MLPNPCHHTSTFLEADNRGLVEAFKNSEQMGMLDTGDDSSCAERRATRPPAALVIDGRGSTGVTL